MLESVSIQLNSILSLEADSPNVAVPDSDNDSQKEITEEVDENAAMGKIVEMAKVKQKLVQVLGKSLPRAEIGYRNKCRFMHF